MLAVLPPPAGSAALAPGPAAAAAPLPPPVAEHEELWRAAAAAGAPLMAAALLSLLRPLPQVWAAPWKPARSHLGVQLGSLRALLLHRFHPRLRACRTGKVLALGAPCAQRRATLGEGGCAASASCKKPPGSSCCPYSQARFWPAHACLFTAQAALPRGIAVRRGVR